MTAQDATRKVQPVWVTVNMVNCNPKGLIHITEGNDKTLCDKKISGSRWYIGTNEEPTCKVCLRRQGKLKEFRLKDLCNMAENLSGELHKLQTKPALKFDVLDHKRIIYIQAQLGKIEREIEYIKGLV
jgi:hypothetical protein